MGKFSRVLRVCTVNPFVFWTFIFLFLFVWVFSHLVFFQFYFNLSVVHLFFLFLLLFFWKDRIREPHNGAVYTPNIPLTLWLLYRISITPYLYPHKSSSHYKSECYFGRYSIHSDVCVEISVYLFFTIKAHKSYLFGLPLYHIHDISSLLSFVCLWVAVRMCAHIFALVCVFSLILLLNHCHVMNVPVKNSGRVVSWVLEHIVQQQMEKHDQKVWFYEQCCRANQKNDSPGIQGKNGCRSKSFKFTKNEPK